MAELVTEGKISYLGLSELTGDQLRAACAVHPIAAVQKPTVGGQRIPTSTQLLGRAPESLVACLILLHGLGADTPALGDLQSLLFGPGTYFSPIDPRRRLAACRSARAAQTNLPRSADIRRHRLGQLGAVILGQVNFVSYAVDAKRHGLGALRTVDIIGDNDRHNACHALNRAANSRSVKLSELFPRLKSFAPRPARTCGHVGRTFTRGAFYASGYRACSWRKVAAMPAALCFRLPNNFRPAAFAGPSSL